MISNAELRARARAALGNYIFNNVWLWSLLLYIIYPVSYTTLSKLNIPTFIFYGLTGVSIAGVFLSISRTGEAPKFVRIFDGFKNFGPNLLLGLMITLFTFLWMLLFIIPGIVKMFSYSMAYFIRVDHPEYDWKRCMHESEDMMRGHRWRLFCLMLSFIGWIIVGILALGVGVLWVAPYIETTTAVFYDDLKNNRLRPLKESEAVEN